MPCRGVSDARRQAAAYQPRCARSRGERPVYRAMQAEGGRWYVLSYPWLVIDGHDRRSALEAPRNAVQEWLGVDREAFDVESG